MEEGFLNHSSTGMTFFFFELISSFLCINFYIVEIIANGGGTMKDRITKIMKENGFLIFLFICVCIVAVGTLSIVLREVDKDKPSEDLVILDNPIDPDSNQLNIGIGSASKDPETGEIVSDYVDEEDQDQEQEQDIAEEQDTTEELYDQFDDAEEVFYEGEDEDDDDDEEIEFIDNYSEEPSQASTTSKDLIMPIQGDIITEFAQDKLIYSETLEEWRGHSGIDIKAEIGANVIAPMDGTVTKVYEDSLWGKTIVIDHGNGLETKYCNLGTLEMVKEGLNVKQGDYIATVGKSAQIELLMEDHLHFEVIKNQKTVDPRSIIR